MNKIEPMCGTVIRPSTYKMLSIVEAEMSEYTPEVIELRQLLSYGMDII